MLKLLLLMNFMVPPLWTCLNGKSSVNSALETTYYLMILTCSVTANSTPNTIRAKHTYFYTCKTHPSHSLTWTTHWTKHTDHLFQLLLLLISFLQHNAQPLKLLCPTTHNTLPPNHCKWSSMEPWEWTNITWLGACKMHFIHHLQITQTHLLLLTPTSVVTFSINTLTIYSGLHIPITNMLPLKGQSLAGFQEWILHICYVLIDEMSFIGPNILSNIDSHLREVFPSHSTCSFGGFSIILIGDLGQLPL